MLDRRISDFRRKFTMEKDGFDNPSLATINALAYAIEARDPYTHGHSERVAAYSVWLGQSMGLPKKTLNLLRFCCKLHDVGKISISDAVLLKHGRLTFSQRAQIEQHPLYGAEILGDLKFIAKGIGIILHHHERYDGKGYPYGLKKNSNPLEARIVCIADAFDAMTSNRPYRRALPLKIVSAEIHRNAGTQFDPYISKIFLKLLESRNPALFHFPSIR